MQVEGKSIEECVKEFEEAMSHLNCESCICCQRAMPAMRQSIASVLLYAKSRMPDKERIGERNTLDVMEMKGGWNRAIDDCHAVLDEQIEEAKS